MSISGEPTEERLWSRIAASVIINTVSHPIEYARVLIQIGHEPILPRETRTLFGKPALALPNVFQYVKHIKRVDGFTGCYRGFVPKMCSYTLSAVAMEKVSESFLFTELYPPIHRDDEDIEDLPDEKKKDACRREIIKDIVTKVVGIIACHPLDVVTLRMMAQFVGRETKYNGVIQSFVEIYKENGIMGYYAGLVPRLISHISTLALVGYSTYFINKYFIHDRDSKKYTSTIMTFLFSTFTYPLLVVYNCMAVNNSGLVAGMPPNMPLYISWTDCWSHLSSMNQLKRGSSLLWRYYSGPQIIINGRLVALTNKQIHYHK